MIHPDYGGTYVSNYGANIDGTVTYTFGTDSTDYIRTNDNTLSNEASFYDNRGDDGYVSDDAESASDDIIRVKRSPFSRSHFEAVQEGVRRSQVFAAVYFSPRYRARSRPWTGQNFRRLG